MQNTVISSENEWGGKESEECRMVKDEKAEARGWGAGGRRKTTQLS